MTNSSRSQNLSNFLGKYFVWISFCILVVAAKKTSFLKGPPRQRLEKWMKRQLAFIFFCFSGITIKHLELFSSWFCFCWFSTHENEYCKAKFHSTSSCTHHQLRIAVRCEIIVLVSLQYFRMQRGVGGWMSRTEIRWTSRWVEFRRIAKISSLLLLFKPMTTRPCHGFTTTSLLFVNKLRRHSRNSPHYELAN